MTTLLYANNAAGTLSAPITNTQTTFTLNGSAASLFPTPSAGQAFYGTFTDAATQTLIEIVLVSSNSSGVFTCTRGQDGTSALSWNAGDIFSQRVVRAELQKFEAAADAAQLVITGYINGFTLSNDATLPNTVLDSAAGYAADSTNVIMITGTAFKKSTAGLWAAGSGNNGMGTGLTIAASTWYHVFGIINTGAYDVYFDTSPSAANAPAGTTSFRYLGSFETNASSQILPFTQVGQKFIWATNKLDLIGGTATSPTAVTLSTPLGFVTYPILIAQYSGSAAGDQLAIAPGQYSGASDAIVDVQLTGGIPISQQVQTTTNASSQIFYFGTGGSVTGIATTGYINPHVAPNF